MVHVEMVRTANKNSSPFKMGNLVIVQHHDDPYIVMVTGDGEQDGLFSGTVVMADRERFVKLGEHRTFSRYSFVQYNGILSMTV